MRMASATGDNTFNQHLFKTHHHEYRFKQHECHVRRLAGASGARADCRPLEPPWLYACSAKLQAAYDYVVAAMLEACRSLGYNVFADQNGLREEGGTGFALMNQIIRDGRRQSMARAYL